MTYDSLYGFRQRAHQYLGRAHDATFELVDAVLTTRRGYSFAELSQSPLFRRQWSSVYEALQDSRPQRQRLMRLYLEQIPRDGPIVLAGDHTGWPRPEAKRLRERTYEHQANSGGSLGPVSLGQGYSTLAWIPETEGSWALPLRHKRITSWESPISLAAFQREQILAAVEENATAQERELATLMTRAPKGKEIPREELRTYWQQQAQALKLEHPQLVWALAKPICSRSVCLSRRIIGCGGRAMTMPWGGAMARSLRWWVWRTSR